MGAGSLPSRSHACHHISACTLPPGPSGVNTQSYVNTLAFSVLPGGLCPGIIFFDISGGGRGFARPVAKTPWGSVSQDRLCERAFRPARGPGTFSDA